MKVIKYKNHGICMIGGEENEYHEKFLFSFFELSNNKGLHNHKKYIKEQLHILKKI